MNDQLYRLVYISRNEITGDDETVHCEIEKILTVSRKNNAIANISGALLFNAGCFAQVLEGLHDDLQNSFERIQCDSRHSNVIVLAFEKMAERRFPSWSMAYFGADSDASAKFGDIMQQSELDASLLKGNQIFDVLNEYLLDAEPSSV
jgi:Sensors of blue-light using FAD